MPLNFGSIAIDERPLAFCIYDVVTRPKWMIFGASKISLNHLLAFPKTNFLI